MTGATPPPPDPEAGFTLPSQAVAPTKRSNGFGTAAFIFGFIAFVPLGLIFGILGLVRARKVGGLGRALSWAGIALSVGWIIGLAAPVIVPALDRASNPGCIAAESVMAQSTPGVEAAGSDRAALIGEFRNVVDGLKVAEARSTNAKATGAITMVVNDYQELIADVENGQAPSSDLRTRLVADGAALNRACSRI